MQEEESNQLKKEYDQDLLDMVNTYRAFKKLGVIGVSVFGFLLTLAGLIWSVIKIVKGLK